MAENSEPMNSKHKERAKETYVTYELERRSRSGDYVIQIKIKRVFIPGEVTGWKVGHFTKRSGRIVNGIKISYDRERVDYQRDGSEQRRSDHLELGDASLSKVVELPEKAAHVQLFADKLSPSCF